MMFKVYVSAIQTRDLRSISAMIIPKNICGWFEADDLLKDMN